MKYSSASVPQTLTFPRENCLDGVAHCDVCAAHMRVHAGEITRNINSLGWSGPCKIATRYSRARVRVLSPVSVHTRPLSALVLAHHGLYIVLAKFRGHFIEIEQFRTAITGQHAEVCIFANETGGWESRDCICAPIGYCEPRLNPRGGYQLSRYSCYSRWNRRKSAFPWFLFFFFRICVAIFFPVYFAIDRKFRKISFRMQFCLFSCWFESLLACYCHFEIERKCWFFFFAIWIR